MKMKVADVIRKSNDEVIAKIIGAVVLQHTEGISAEKAIDFDYPNTLKELQKEVEVNYKQTNADRIRSMSDEELADFIRELNECCLAGAGKVDCTRNEDCVDCRGVTLDWLQSEAEE